MKTSLTYIFLLAVLVLSTATTVQGQKLLPTSLRITVLDELGNVLQDATVKIYESQDGYLNNSTPLDSAITDKKGMVRFKRLKPQVYFIDVRKDDLNNDGQGAETGELEEGKSNRVNVVVR